MNAGRADTATAADAAASLATAQAGSLPGLLGLEWIEARRGFARSRLDVARHHLAPTGYLHAATVVALADTACGFGCLASLPEGAFGFTTVELKVNFIGTARDGGIACEARLVHAGRTTQVWDATVESEATRKAIALFRCTQIVLRPGASRANRSLESGASGGPKPRDREGRYQRPERGENIRK